MKVNAGWERGGGWVQRVDTSCIAVEMVFFAEKNHCMSKLNRIFAVPNLIKT